MQIKVALNGGDRLLVEIGADARQRGGRLSVTASDDATHVDCGETGSGTDARCCCHAWQHAHVVGEVADVQFFELLGADCLDADGHVLQVLTALLRGDDDFFETTAVLGCGDLPAQRDDHGGGNG